MHKLLTEIQAALRIESISLTDDSWLGRIPRSPGWYVLATDAPWDVLQQLAPSPNAPGHYRIGERVGRVDTLRHFDVLIEPKPHATTPIYNGHARNLQARAREHLAGHPKTGCLALAQYDALKAYSWEFHHAAVSDLPSKPPDSSALRTIGEQLWRAEYGWPILCIE